MKGATPGGPRMRSPAERVPGRSRAARASAGKGPLGASQPRGQNCSASIPRIVRMTSGFTNSVGVNQPVTSRPRSRTRFRASRLGRRPIPRRRARTWRRSGAGGRASDPLLLLPLRVCAGPAPLVRGEQGPWNAPQKTRRPRGPVPQTTEDHRDEDVDQGPPFTHPVPAQRDVQVVAQPPGERHVPATPEVLDRRAWPVGRSSSGTETEQLRGPDRDVGVAAEVRVDHASRSRRCEERVGALW